MNLAAIVHSGHKSLHCWFEQPPKTTRELLFSCVDVLGLDDNFFKNATQACKMNGYMPGFMHEKTGRKSKLLWLRHLDCRR